MHFAKLLFSHAVICLHCEAAVTSQSVRAFALHAYGWVFESYRKRPMSLKQEVTAPFINAPQHTTGVSVMGPRR